VEGWLVVSMGVDHGGGFWVVVNSRWWVVDCGY
jgi:hypothetical protein